MKKFAAVLLSVMLCLTLFALAGCGEKSGGKDDGGTQSADNRVKYTSQIDKAETTYGNIRLASEKNGSLFAEASAEGAMLARSVLVSASAYGGERKEKVTIRDIKDIIEANASPSLSLANTFNSYIADIFTYMQVQLAIIKQYDIASLINTYNLTYQGLDLTDVVLRGVSKEVFKAVLPITATFPGADLETGKVYCQHSHISRSDRRVVDTQLEFYYNTDRDMGVTTLNKHLDENGNPVRFEYDYFDFGYGLMIIANADIKDGVIGDFRSLMLCTQNSVVNQRNLPVADYDTVNSFVLSETDRIYGKISGLKEANSAMESELSVEKDETVKSCNVTMDFALLESMFIKNRT